MADLTPAEEYQLREAIGVCIDHGNLGLAGAIAQWITTKKTNQLRQAS